MFQILLPVAGGQPPRFRAHVMILPPLPPNPQITQLIFLAQGHWHHDTSHHRGVIAPLSHRLWQKGVESWGGAEGG